MSIEKIKEIIDFIETDACRTELHEIASALEDNGYEFECSECEEREIHGCGCEYDVDEDYERNEFIKHLIARANQFGLSDMLEELKREGNRVGAYLDTGAKA